MNEEIPKTLRNALARKTVGEVHPSPDVLTAFVERTLTPVESEVLSHHLAQCTECRETVFLASDAAEDEVSNERELVAAAASRVAAMPAYADSPVPAAARTEAPRPRWTTRMRWAVSLAAAVVLVSAGLVVQFSRVGKSHNPAPITVASSRPVPASTAAQQTATTPSLPQASAKAPVPEALAKPASHQTTTARYGRVSPSTTVAKNDADQFQAAPAMEAAPRVARPQATPSAVGDMSSALVPAVRPQSSFVESETGQALELRKGAPALFAKPQTGMHAVSTARPRWRIGPEGHVERSMTADQWTRVLNDQPITFRAVAVVGNDVWAGGNGGALFHSFDGGEHWSKVSLAANSNVETAAIASIHFSDSGHGVVATDSGTRWTTTDGGVTWTPQ